MAGLMPQGGLSPDNQSAPPPATQPQSIAAPGDNGADGGGAADNEVPDDQGSNVTPEEQKAYEAFVLQGYDLLYNGGKVRPEILKLLDDDPADLKKELGQAFEPDAPADESNPSGGTVWDALRPTMVLAAAGAIVTLEVLKGYGKDQPEGAIIFHGGKAILEDLAEIAQKAGIHDYSEAELGEAFRRGADIFQAAARAEGLIDVDAAKADWNELVAADKEGRADQIVPGIGKLAPQPAADAQAPPQAAQ